MGGGRILEISSVFKDEEYGDARKVEDTSGNRGGAG
jgi:hypothetical protein